MKRQLGMLKNMSEFKFSLHPVYLSVFSVYVACPIKLYETRKLNMILETPFILRLKIFSWKEYLVMILSSCLVVGKSGRRDRGERINGWIIRLMVVW